MKIRTRVKIAGTLTILILLAYGAVVLYLDRTMSHLTQEVIKTNEIVNKISILRGLTQDYLLYRTERAQRQWSAVYVEVLKLLYNPEYRVLQSEYGIGDVSNKLKIVGDTFARLMTIQPTSPADKSVGGARGELQNRLTSQLILATQDLLTRFFNLDEAINGKLISTQRLFSSLNILALLVLGVLLISNSVFLQRSVVKPVLKLHKGAEIIGAGDLNYKVGLASQDEIGELSRAFDRMTANLQKVTVSRDDLVKEMKERQQAEDSLRESRSQLQTIFDNLTEGVIVSTMGGQFLTWNQAALKMHGYASLDKCCDQLNDLTDTFELATTDGVVLPLEQWPFSRILHGERLGDLELRVRRLDKEWERIYDYGGEVVRDQVGNPLLAIVSMADITERKNAEEALRRAHDALEETVLERTAELLQSREELRQAYENYRIVADFTYDWEVWLHQNGTIQYISPSCHRISGYKMEEFIRRPDLFREIVLPEDRDLWDRHMCEVGEGHTSREIQFRIFRSDGTIRWLEHVCQPVVTESGKFLGIRSSNRDITDRKQAELELKEALLNIEQLKEQLEIDYGYLQEEIKLELGFDQIIGKSDALRYVLFNVEQVAPSDTTVLILGETGTGKELIARAIHDASPLAKRALVKVDCAALSPSLIESELFGHEKGAFTGASNRKVGRFELAHGSTLFLDEIGELPLELQGKLLRLLQAGEFERLGRSKTLKVDVRIIAATNRVLDEEVKQGRFREDLFYRLNVFPITVPPLRKRKDDIPLLAQFFMERFAKKLGKDIKKIPPGILEALQSYSWPGNIRELENCLERAVIHTKGPVLQLPGKIFASPTGSPEPPTKSLAVLEKDYILQILKHVDWRIEGEQGAAAKLGLNPSTLRGRMRKLGLARK
jgi:formate hydrogenlyase transcriptional activator